MASEPERIEQTDPRIEAAAIAYEFGNQRTERFEWWAKLPRSERERACQIARRMFAAADDVDPVRAELGSYGPPETEWGIQSPGEESALDYDDKQHAEENLKWFVSGEGDGYVVSRLVRRGPWVTTEKPNADIRDDPSEGIPAFTEDEPATQHAVDESTPWHEAVCVCGHVRILHYDYRTYCECTDCDCDEFVGASFSGLGSP